MKRASKPLLILASASPRRRQLLKTLRRPFRVEPSGVSERSRRKHPRSLVRELALRKAGDVARRHSGKPVWVIGADTVVAHRGLIMGKPRDRRHAYQMLYRMSDSMNDVYTGVAIWDAETGRRVAAVAVSRVFMRKMDIDTLLRLSRKHLDKAGAYAIQERRDPIARVVKGDFDNVVGLPMRLVRQLLRSPALRSRSK